MKIILTSEQKADLELRHASERDKKVCDRIKAILLRDEGWSVTHIAQALRLHNDTVSRYIISYITESKLQANHKGSSENMTDSQREELVQHLEENFYGKVADICSHIKRSYGIDYTVSGITSWLHRHNFSYKQMKKEPANADISKQQKFVKKYNRLKGKARKNEPIYFIDSVHPTMESKNSRGWIRTGKEKVLLTSASRTRLNISGAINLGNMKTIIEEYKTVNAETTISFLEKIRLNTPNAKTIHIILDCSGYHRSKDVAKFARENGFKLHFLPPYSPNLNPIERLWKVMNEEVRNNRYFRSAKIFRDSVMGFFNDTLPALSKSLSSRINDSFHIAETANSS